MATLAADTTFFTRQEHTLYLYENFSILPKNEKLELEKVLYKYTHICSSNFHFFVSIFPRGDFC
jgi:hypothetical protein